LHSGVSKQISANCPRRTCSSLAATFENIILSEEMPKKIVNIIVNIEQNNLI